MVTFLHPLLFNRPSVAAGEKEERAEKNQRNGPGALPAHQRQRAQQLFYLQLGRCLRPGPSRERDHGPADRRRLGVRSAGSGVSCRYGCAAAVVPRVRGCPCTGSHPVMYADFRLLVFAREGYWPI